MVLFTIDDVKESDILEMQDTLREIKINHSYDTRIGGIPPDWGAQRAKHISRTRDCPGLF